MFPSDTIPTTTNVQPKHNATAATKNNVMSTKTRANSSGTFAGQSK
jgi:hypothetical protein